MQLYQLQQHHVSGLLSPSLFDEIDANTAKTGITSGQSSAITANTAKTTNVSTDLSISGTTGARTIESSDGTDAIIPIATTSCFWFIITWFI
jgi:hypothetical protein